MDSVLLFTLLIFTLSLTGLLVSTQVFLYNAERLGIVLGVSPFVIGSFIVAFGTSVPELSISLFSVFNGIVDLPVAQTVGSNVVNILLVIGIAAILAKRISITKNLIDVELPLIASVTLIFIFIIFDGTVNLFEAIVLAVGFLVYMAYIFLSKENRSYPLGVEEKLQKTYAIPKHFSLFLVSSGAITFFSLHTVKSLEGAASMLSIPEGIIAVTILALGTSLPEIAVTVRAVLDKNVEIVIGNIIGSNILNILFVVGVPALFATLTVDSPTLKFGVPMLAVATLLFIISGISNRVHVWEGIFFILFYLLFIVKIVGVL